MTILVLCSLLIIGLILLLAEILFIPGTTIVGAFGLLVSIAGVIYTFLSYDVQTAWLITGIAAVLNISVIIYGFNSGVWNKFSLKSSIQGGTFDGRTDGFQVGMPGKALSDLKPFGKGIFAEQIVEIKSEGGFIGVDSDITIIKIENNKIIVK
jgi:membrane-bound ClpP family serine protease